mmetsp:Transcript_52168/g.138097  ORF Transcript_52168/g.138097 Transcript_52168/m.138097 type:complete len:450 (+) Transcript_52168:1404-2753(+)
MLRHRWRHMVRDLDVVPRAISPVVPLVGVRRDGIRGLLLSQHLLVAGRSVDDLRLLRGDRGEVVPLPSDGGVGSGHSRPAPPLAVDDEDPVVGEEHAAGDLDGLLHLRLNHIVHPHVRPGRDGDLANLPGKMGRVRAQPRAGPPPPQVRGEALHGGGAGAAEQLAAAVGHVVQVPLAGGPVTELSTRVMVRAQPLRRVIQLSIPLAPQQSALRPQASPGTPGKASVLREVPAQGHSREGGGLGVPLLSVGHLVRIGHLDKLFVTHAHIIPPLNQLPGHHIRPHIPRRIHRYLQVPVRGPHPPENPGLRHGPRRGGRKLGERGGGHPGAVEENRVVDADAGGSGRCARAIGVVDVGYQLSSNSRELKTRHSHRPSPPPSSQLHREKRRQRHARPSRSHRPLQLLRPMHCVKRKMRFHLPWCGGHGCHGDEWQLHHLCYRAGDRGGDQPVL